MIVCFQKSVLICERLHRILQTNRLTAVKVFGLHEANFALILDFGIRYMLDVS